jgi:AcrR family transcriptional regulator
MDREAADQLAPPRPRRADARRNYEKLVEAARAAFAEGGADTSLEEVARRAGVGIATLYRNFPERAVLLETIYLEDVQELCDSAADFDGLSPWDAFAGWMRRLTAYLVAKQALSPVLLGTFQRDAEVFQRSRAALVAVAEPLLRRAQDAGAVRADTDFTEVLKLAGGVARIPVEDPAEIDHILGLALDGLRYGAPGPGR